ncbi:nucleoporin NUP42 isoform X1 [Monodelphis domestica]|uniref:nucleoporin NUP42 isoform X1 n=2 Tax=Monodelphis domestica TaxID=13616 RepID=UPI0024E20A48|nr:nucleoporin NUP42 isoform X1 [Monodelphis domestica]
MTICHFFLQGRCRFGERCWNEHPRGGGGSGGGGGGGGGRSPAQPQYAAAPSGCSRGGWSNSSQRYTNVIQPSNFSKSATWGGSRDPGKTFFGSFDSGASSSGSRNLGFSQTRFSALNPNQVDGQKDDDDKLIEGIVKDMEVWESSGQWMFSVYSPMKEKPNISGFTDISPEELRLEYSNHITSKNLQSYLNSIQQLVNLWKNRLLELRNINTATKGAVLSKLKNEGNQVVPTFGFHNQQTSTFGSSGFPVNTSTSSGAQNFSFKPTSGFSAAPSGSSTSVFGAQGMPAAPALTGASSNSTITTSAPTSFGFGESAAVSAASFSFKSPEVFSFGSAGFSGFPAPPPLAPAGATANPAFGGGSSAAGGSAFPPSSSSSGATLSGLPASTFGSGGPSASLPASGGNNASEHLFTPKNELTAEELKQFMAKKFTLGKVPLKPPPEGLLSV